MSRAYMIRCQGAGILYDKVFPLPPTDEQLREALTYELERHGVKWIYDAKGKAVGAEALECWVQVQATELMDDTVDSEEELKYELRRTFGKMNDEQLQAFFEARWMTAPGVVAAAVPTMSVMGTGRVINPGDPDFEASKTPESMEITSADVGVISSSDFLDPPK